MGRRPRLADLPLADAKNFAKFFEHFWRNQATLSDNDVWAFAALAAGIAANRAQERQFDEVENACKNFVLALNKHRGITEPFPVTWQQ